MPARQTISDEVELLLTQKGKTCVSIVLPLHNSTIDQKADRIHLAKAVSKICETLRTNFTEEADKLIESLNYLHQQIEFNRNDEGIGLYISDEVVFYTTFPFTVAENIIASKSFRLRELLMMQQYALPYNVLYVDKKEIRLFAGRSKQLQEIRNGEFPLIYQEDYEYQASSQASSMAGYAHVKSFERDKTLIEKTRHEAFMQEAEDLLHHYLQNSGLILLYGNTRSTSAFLNRTAFADKIYAVINGNYKLYDEDSFSSMAWPLIKESIHKKMIDEVNEYSEKVGEGMAEKGIVSIWEAVTEGRGDVLLVEKNYQPKAFLDYQNNWQLYLKPPVNRHILLEDAVNSLLETLLQKNGRVLFTEDGMLDQYLHIALITRY